MDRATLDVTPRTILGKKVKQLRKSGLVPAHMYGYQTEPINMSVDNKTLLETYKHSGETGLIDLKLGETTYPVLIQNMQQHAVTDEVLNVDFYKVNLKEKVTVSIPLMPIGEPIAVEQKLGILEQPISEVEIEALPTDLIEHIEVDVTKLANIDDALYVKDLHVPTTIEILSDPEEMVFKIGPLMTAEMEALEAEVEAEAEAAEVEAQAVEGAEGEESEVTEGETVLEGEEVPKSTEEQK